MIQLLHGDCRDILPTLPEQSVQCVVTSPPYWRLRKYSDDPREIGQEPTIAEYVAALVRVFDEVWRVLKDDGVLWLNLGDAYANDTKWGGQSGGKNYTSAAGGCQGQRVKSNTGLPPKSLIGIPWRVAFALQDRGWVLRNEIIWHKPAAMPENVNDRFTRDHEHLFFFSKQSHYYFDQASVAAPAKRAGDTQTFGGRKGRAYTPAADDPNFRNGSEQWGRTITTGETRNLRTVWSIASQTLRDEHYAAYPEALIEPCILAGSKPRDTILDPFVGSGTTCRVAERLQRHSFGIDLAYQELQERRTDGVQVMMTEVL